MLSQRGCERVADLWVRWLRDPRYDNGDTSSEGAFNNAVGGAMASMLHNNSNEENLEEFRKELIKTLHALGDTCYDIGSDYQADRNLQGAADRAGLKMAFPYKHSMSWFGNALCVHQGYGKSVYHYELDGGKWLITSLYGADIDKVIEYVQGGQPEFVVE